MKYLKTFESVNEGIYDDNARDMVFDIDNADILGNAEMELMQGGLPQARNGEVGSWPSILIWRKGYDKELYIIPKGKPGQYELYDDKGYERGKEKVSGDSKKILTALKKAVKVFESVNESLNKSDLAYQLSLDYSGNSKPKITKLNKKELNIHYGYKTAPQDVIASFKKLYPDKELIHIGWSPGGKGGVHSFKIEESVNEAIDRATTVFQVATPAPQGILVKELEKLLPNKTIVTEVGDADGYESVLLFDLSGKDLKLIRDNIGDVLVWKYPIGKSKDVITGPNESVNEAKDNLYLQMHKKYAKQIKGLKAKKIKKLTDLVSVQRWSMEDRDDYFNMDPKKKKELSAEYNEERKLFKKYMARDHSVMLPKGTEALPESVGFKFVKTFESVNENYMRDLKKLDQGDVVIDDEGNEWTIEKIRWWLGSPEMTLRNNNDKSTTEFPEDFDDPNFFSWFELKESVNEATFNYMKDSDEVRDLFKDITGKSGVDDLDSDMFSAGEDIKGRGGWILNVDDSSLSSAMAAKFVKAVMKLGKKKGWKMQQYGDDAIEIFESVNEGMMDKLEKFIYKANALVFPKMTAGKFHLLFMKHKLDIRKPEVKAYVEETLPTQKVKDEFYALMKGHANESVNEAEKYNTDKFKIGDKIKTNIGVWEVIETDYKPGKKFMAPFIFKGKDMKKVDIPNPPPTNKDAVGYKVTDGGRYPIIGFLYQYKDITKLATVGVDESVNEGKLTEDQEYRLKSALNDVRSKGGPSYRKAVMIVLELAKKASGENPKNIKHALRLLGRVEEVYTQVPAKMVGMDILGDDEDDEDKDKKKKMPGPMGMVSYLGVAEDDEEEESETEKTRNREGRVPGPEGGVGYAGKER
jgi:hypothetical protein